jgi:non-specific serine/threonine protein kinase/serine/threonine-protein kinase
MNDPPSSTEEAVELFFELRRRGDVHDASAFAAQFPELGPELVEALEALLAIDQGVRDARAFEPAVPARVGGYDVLYRIGSGGMGTVYAAEQAHPRRRVALKLLREGSLSERARRRFEYEAELLGRLRHPGIAHIYEAGVADSGFGPTPYLAMELVEGRPLAKWVAESAPNSTRKLELFVELCLAVQHAHERGVIHRDLKPDNILVEKDGRPKVLDFGIARGIGADIGVATRLTETGGFVGTLSYMSPEQLADDIDVVDTRSDVYSLGVILHELVAGRRPHEIEGLAIGKAIETIRFQDPAPLSATANVSRDLELIVAKAIDKDPARRYASAGALADDVQRFLRDEPITARPASTLYQARKLVRKHRAFAIGSVAVLVMLVLGLSGTMWQAHNAELRRREAEQERLVAEKEKDAAEKNAAETKLVADFQSALLAELSVDEFGHSLVVEQRKDLGEGLARIGREPEERERTLVSFDESLRPGNPTNVAQRVLEARVFGPAVEKLEKEYSERQLLAAMIETPLADTLKNLGLYELGARAARSAVDARRANLGENDPRTLASVNSLALLLRAQGKLSEAEPLLRDVLARRRATLGDRHPDTLESVASLAHLLQVQGRIAEAEPLFREAIAGQRAALGDTHPDTLASINDLALLFYRQGKLAESGAMFREAFTGLRAKLGDEHPQTLLARTNLAVSLRDQGKLGEAEPLLREALASSRSRLGDEHPETLTAIGSLAALLQDEGKLAEAEPLAREALEVCRAKLGDEHPYTLTSIYVMASLLQAEGKFAEAESLFREGLAGCRKELGDDHPETLTAMNNLALLLQAEGKLAEAEPLFRDALARRRVALGDLHTSTLNSINNLARVLRTQGKLDEAEPLYREALAGRRAKLGDDDINTLNSAGGLAALLQARGEFLEASTLLEQSIEHGRNLTHNSDAFVRDAERKLRDLYRAWHERDPSAGHDRRADELDQLLKAH